MYCVSYIKQKAIEIANNSSHKIIIGVINQKDVDAGCSAVSSDISVFDDLDSYCDSEFTYNHLNSILSEDPNFFKRRTRAEREEVRMQRKADRIQRRMIRINKL